VGASGGVVDVKRGIKVLLIRPRKMRVEMLKANASKFCSTRVKWWWMVLRIRNPGRNSR